VTSLCEWTRTDACIVTAPSDSLSQLDDLQVRVEAAKIPLGEENNNE
jgi:hypothetical protein